MGTHAELPRRTLAQSGSNGSSGSSSDRSRRSGSWAVAVTAGGTSHDGVRDGGQHIQKKGVHVGEVPVSATRYACACALHLHRKVQGAGTRGPESRHGHLRGQRGGGGRGAGGWTGLGPCNGRPRDHRVRKRGPAAWHTLASPRSWPVPRTGRRRHWCCASTRTQARPHTRAQAPLRHRGLVQSPRQRAGATATATTTTTTAFPMSFSPHLLAAWQEGFAAYEPHVPVGNP